jgi:hypothetical protein
MAIEYVSIKVGDPAIKPSPQVIPPGKWVTLDFGAVDVIVPKHDGVAQWAYYVNFTPVKGIGAPKSVKLRFCRDPKGAADFTGQRPLDLSVDHVFSGVWIFKAKKGQPVALQVYNTGKKPITITTREFKMWIP